MKTRGNTQLSYIPGGSILENLSRFVPSNLKDVEALIQEKGLTEFRPAENIHVIET